MEHRSQKKKKFPIGKIFKYAALSCLVLTFSVILFAIGYLLGIDEWQSFDPRQIEENMQRSTLLYDGDGEEYLILSGQQARCYTNIEEIPDHVKNAFLAIEDTRFYEHNGIDVVRIMGALVEDIKSGSIRQGASTISQQLIKHSSLILDQDITRKLVEIMMAFRLEKTYTKDEILELYLNQIYFGKGAYGVETAARAYFGKHVSELSVSEGAMLAGIIKSPTNYAPHLHFEKSLDRKDLVLSQMLENGFLTQEEYDTAKKQKIVLANEDKEEYPYGFYTDMVLKDACSALGLGYTELMTGGYRIYTNLQPELQSKLESLSADASLFPENAADGEKCENAAVVLDAQTGSILAIQGGREHTTRLAFNRAVSMRRQPGSAIKPVMVYAPALEYLDYSTTTFLLDQPENFGGYTPRNSGSSYKGWVTMRDCVAYSINIPAVKLLNEVTVARAKGYAASVGIPFGEKDKNLSLALGGFTTGVTPLELCASYLPFSSGGYYGNPSAIQKIVDSEGNTVYEWDQTKYNVLSDSSAFLMSSMLSSSVEYGTSKQLKTEGIPLCAKTGTSTYDDATNNKDAWIVAYNPQYIFCSWIGFDKTDSLHSLPQGVTGGTYPAQYAKQFFSYLYQGKQAPSFSPPSGIISAKIDGVALREQCEVRLAGVLTEEGDTQTEYFTRQDYERLAAGAIPSPPDDFKVVTGADGWPILRFTAKSSSAYLVSRFDSASGQYIQIAKITTPGPVELLDDTAQNAQQYIYRVTPISTSGQVPGEDSKSAFYLYSSPGLQPSE